MGGTETRRNPKEKNLPLITTGDTDRKEIGKRKGFQNGINAERRSRRIEAASAYIFYNFQRHPTDTVPCTLRQSCLFEDIYAIT
jgi:hypothetical protein